MAARVSSVAITIAVVIISIAANNAKTTADIANSPIILHSFTIFSSISPIILHIFTIFSTIPPTIFIVITAITATITILANMSSTLRL